MTVGKKIRQIRLLRGYTQAVLGKKVGLSGDRIRQYENDVRTPKKDKAQKIADALEVDISAISDVNISTVPELLHTLFELEECAGLKISKVDNRYILFFDEDSEGDEIQEALDCWYNAKQEFQPNINDDYKTIEQKKQDYLLWKYRFPIDTKKHEKEQSKAVKQHFEALRSERVKTEISTFKDVALVFDRLFKSKINLEFKWQKDDIKAISDPVAIASFSNSELLNSQTESESAFTDFLDMVDTLNEMGMQIDLRTHTSDGETFSDFAFHSPQITSMQTALKKRQQHIKEHTENEMLNSIEFENTLNTFDVPVKDYL